MELRGWKHQYMFSVIDSEVILETFEEANRAELREDSPHLRG